MLGGRTKPQNEYKPQNKYLIIIHIYFCPSIKLDGLPVYQGHCQKDLQFLIVGSTEHGILLMLGRHKVTMRAAVLKYDTTFQRGEL